MVGPRARALSVAEFGGRMRIFTVNAAIENGSPLRALIGTAMESWPQRRDRIRAAVTRSGLAWPYGEIDVMSSPNTVNVGEASDLAVAVAILAASGQVPAAAAQDAIFYAGLGNDGCLRPVPDITDAATAVAAAGVHAALVVAASDIGYTARVPGLPGIGARTLGEVTAWLREAPEACFPSLIRTGPPPVPDMATLPGNWLPRIAAEVCAAGGHSLSLIGQPGSGAELLAARLPGILPPLDEKEATEVTRLHNAAGVIRADAPPVTVPPFITAGPDTTMAQMLGGGPELSRPGAASLAHHGVLFLHQAPEMRREVLDALRQPLEAGAVALARGGPCGPTATFPARFLLVVSASPCPCTAKGASPEECQCTPATRRRYLGRLSGPLTDRVTVKAWMTIPSKRDAQVLSPCTAVIAARVRAARDRAARRLSGTPWRVNAGIPTDALGAFPVDLGALGPVDHAVDAGQVSQRGAVQVQRLAWTIADLGGNVRPNRSDVLAALGFYCGDHEWLSQYSGNRHFPVPH
jgi:magnesium chelatase family protein